MPWAFPRGGSVRGSPVSSNSAPSAGVLVVQPTGSCSGHGVHFSHDFSIVSWFLAIPRQTAGAAPQNGQGWATTTTQAGQSGASTLLRQTAQGNQHLVRK